MNECNDVFLKKNKIKMKKMKMKKKQIENFFYYIL